MPRPLFCQQFAFNLFLLFRRTAAIKPVYFPFAQRGSPEEIRKREIEMYICLRTETGSLISMETENVLLARNNAISACDKRYKA